MSIASLTPLVREALGVSSSYDATSIPAWIKAAARRLLRDYNFPKSKTSKTWSGADIVSQIGMPQPSFALPAGLGKIGALRLSDSNNNWSDPLVRRERFVLASTGDVNSWMYWLDAQNLRLSNPITAEMSGYFLQLWYQSIDPDTNTWIYDDFEDLLRYMVVYREAAAMRKPEVQAAFQSLYTEELSALAIYLNELEWDGVVINQREARTARSERYPAS